MVIFQVISDDSTNDIASSNPASLQLPSYLFQKTEPVTYGDVAATSCDVEDLENRPPNNVSFILPVYTHNFFKNLSGECC